MPRAHVPLVPSSAGLQQQTCPADFSDLGCHACVAVASPRFGVGLEGKGGAAGWSQLRLTAQPWPA